MGDLNRKSSVTAMSRQKSPAASTSVREFLISSFRRVALDPSCNGRSRQVSFGNDMNGYADDMPSLRRSISRGARSSVTPPTTSWRSISAATMECLCGIDIAARRSSRQRESPGDRQMLPTTIRTGRSRYRHSPSSSPSSARIPCRFRAPAWSLGQDKEFNGKGYRRNYAA